MMTQRPRPPQPSERLSGNVRGSRKFAPPCIGSDGMGLPLRFLGPPHFGPKLSFQ